MDEEEGFLLLLDDVDLAGLLLAVLLAERVVPPTSSTSESEPESEPESELKRISVSHNNMFIQSTRQYGLPENGFLIFFFAFFLLANLSFTSLLQRSRSTILRHIQTIFAHSTIFHGCASRTITVGFGLFATGLFATGRFGAFLFATGLFATGRFGAFLFNRF